MTVIVERVEVASDEARDLLHALDGELSGSYGPHQSHALTFDQVFQPQIRFFIARIDGAAVGCGGVARDRGFAELKRMYVVPAARGRGVVQAILARLEAEAASQGFSRLMLETGDVQLAAIRAYEKGGFRQCAAFGDYLLKTPDTIERSVFMEKQIG